MAGSLKAIEKLAAEAYREAHLLLEDPAMKAVVTHGLNILYGPPMVRPDIAFLSFQGGGDDGVVQQAWPERLLYTIDDFKFGNALKKFCGLAGLRESFMERAIAMPAMFPQAKDKNASAWKRKNDNAINKWRVFSLYWGQKLLCEQSPRVLMVFGKEASDLYELSWRDRRCEHGQNHMTFGRAEWMGIPAIYCKHPSRPARSEVMLNSFLEAQKIIREQK